MYKPHKGGSPPTYIARRVGAGLKCTLPTREAPKVLAQMGGFPKCMNPTRVGAFRGHAHRRQSSKPYIKTVFTLTPLDTLPCTILVIESNQKMRETWRGYDLWKQNEKASCTIMQLKVAKNCANCWSPRVLLYEKIKLRSVSMLIVDFLSAYQGNGSTLQYIIKTLTFLASTFGAVAIFA